MKVIVGNKAGADKVAIKNGSKTFLDISGMPH